jgi:cobalt-zinc-cadmium resistance protein CzcA
MWILRFFLQQRALSILAVVLTLVLGVLAWRSLPIDAYPDVTNVQVMVLTRAEGLATTEVERLISHPIELAMSGLPQVREIRSLSRNELSQVNVVFEDDVDAWFARQLVHERLSGVEGSLPPGAEAELAPMSTGLGEIYQYSLESKGHSPTELRSLQDWVVAPRLKAVPGVTEVNSFGGFVKEYQVLLRPDMLTQYQLTSQDVLAALGRDNANRAGGFILRGDEQSYVIASGLVRSAQELADVVVPRPGGAGAVKLGQLAHVKEGAMPRQGAVTRDGHGEVVAGMAIMLKGENSREVVDRIKAAVLEIAKSLPAGVSINDFYDRTDLIEASIQTVSGALLEGAALVLVVLFLFLWDLRGALVVAASLPLTACLSFMLMHAAGITANLMSLGGLAIAVGMVVDGSIVVVENITSAFKDGRRAAMPRQELALAAASEVFRPVVWSLLVIMAVMIPLLGLTGMEGKMFRPMALTMLFSMGASLLVAVTVVPPLASLLVSRRLQRPEENPMLRFMLRLYRPSLDFALRHRLPLAAVSGAFLLLTLFLLTRLGTEFLPPLDEGSIAINLVRLPSASLDSSRRQAEALESELRARFPEIRAVVSKTGRAELAEDPMGPEQSDLLITLTPRDTWRKGYDKPRIVAEMQEFFASVPGVRPSFSQPIALRVNELISGVKSDVAVKIAGEDLAILGRTAEQVSPILAGIAGAADPRVEMVSGMSEVLLTPKRDALLRYGLDVQTLHDAIQLGVSGVRVGELWEGERRFGIRLGLDRANPLDLASLEHQVLTTPSGQRVQLSELATLSQIESPAQVSRENGRRRLVVECNVRGRDLGSFVAELDRKLEPIRGTLPTGYQITLGGQFENQQRAQERLALLVPAALLLILLMQLSALRDVRSTALVVLNLPFSLTGGVLTIWLLGMNISVSVLVGLIVLFGMAVQHGTILVSYADDLRRGGLEPREAVREAALRRLRPLLMTKLTALLGLLPMMLKEGPGADLQRPLAAVVLGGLFFTTFLNLYVVPASYGWFHRPTKT